MAGSRADTFCFSLPKRPLLAAGALLAVLLIAYFLYSFFFSGPPPTLRESELTLVRAIDPNIRLYFATSFPPVEANGTAFASGQAVYPQESGLSKGTRFDFRVVRPDGSPAVPLDDWVPSEIRMGSGIEGAGQFNSPERPVSAGNYALQLVRLEGRTATIVAEKNFTIR